MATMNVSLPETLRTWINGRVEGGDYATASDYVRELVRRDKDYQTELAALRIEIQKGLDSGISNRTIDDIIADIRAKAVKRAAIG